MAKAKPQTVFVVLRTGFEPELSDLMIASTENGILSRVPLAVFSNKKAAEAERQRLTQEAIRSHSFSQVLRFLNETKTLCSLLKQFGLPVPKLKVMGKTYDWMIQDENFKKLGVWWEEHGHKVTPEMNVAIWENCLPDFFYIVEESTLE